MKDEDVKDFGEALSQMRHAYTHEFAWGPQSIPAYWDTLEHMPRAAVMRTLREAPRHFERMPSAHQLLERVRLTAADIAREEERREAEQRASKQLTTSAPPDDSERQLDEESEARAAAFRKRVNDALAEGMTQFQALQKALDGCEIMSRKPPWQRNRG